MLTWVTGIRFEKMMAQERKGRAGVTNMNDIIRDQNVDMGYRNKDCEDDGTRKKRKSWCD